MTQFIFDAVRGAAALLLAVAAFVLIIWAIVPGMEVSADVAGRFAARMRMFNAMFGGFAIIVLLLFCFMAWANNH